MLSTHDSAARADSLVRQAHARAYRYPGGFEGFRAELAWRTDDASETGAVLARTGPEVELQGDSFEEAPNSVVKELPSIVGLPHSAT